MDLDSDDDIYTKTDILDDFFVKYSNKMHDLYYDLKFRFNSISPFFLCNMKLYNLIDFFEDFLVNPVCVLKKTNSRKEMFNTFYKHELDLSYGIVFNFLKTTLKFNLQYNDWLKFCYQFTDKYELYK
jgi:hypothetical protein